MKFAYSGYDRTGKAVSGTFEADSLDAARDALRRDGIFATSVGQNGAGGAGDSRGKRGGGFSLFGGSRIRQVTGFTRQLAVLVSTGTTVVDAIVVLERQTPPGAWQLVIADLRRRVEEGAQLSEAMAQHPAWFNSVARSLVAAGESRGKLGEMLERLAALCRQQLKIRGALTGAMVYPCLLMVIAVAVIITMITFVMPRFEGLFESLGAPLPPTTAALMAASHWLREWWWAVLIGLGLVGAGAYQVLRSDAGKLALDRTLVRLPQIGGMTRAFATARIARLLGVLVEGRVGLFEALELTRAATPNRLYQDLLRRAEEAVEKGEPVSTAFDDPLLINPAVCAALRSGERTGRVGSVLISLADFMDEDNEVVIKSLTSILEPVILIVLGLVVGTMATSMFLPLFDLSANASGGAP
ncbi:MAG: type II secretion system F family protein [Phycisphaerales bacterium]